jgi:hypothetical protein
LKPRSINFLVSGQAFHWFDPVLARKEFSRILTASGWVALIWNDRRTDSTSFLRGYEALLKEFATDYDQTNHKRIDPNTLAVFFNRTPSKKSFPNQQLFDLESLKGRLLSSSYAPESGNPRHEPMLHELERLYNAEQQNGKVAIHYDTFVFYAQPAW